MNANNRLYYIYALIDPFTMDYKYVGSTTNIRNRYSWHITRFDTGKEKSAWIKDLIDNGYKPLLMILDFAIGKRAAEELEVHHIRELGLTNLLFNKINVDFKYPWGEMIWDYKSSFLIKNCARSRAASAQICGSAFYKRWGIGAKVSYRMCGTDATIYVDIDYYTVRHDVLKDIRKVGKKQSKMIFQTNRAWDQDVVDVNGDLDAE